MRHLKKFEGLSAKDLFDQHDTHFHGSYNDRNREDEFSHEEEEENPSPEEECEPCNPEGEEDFTGGEERSHISKFDEFDFAPEPEGDEEVPFSGNTLFPGDSDLEEEEEEEGDEHAHEEEKPWGDEGVRLERFSTFNEKKKEKKDDKEKDARPDYLDFDKDGDKKEPMKKALKDKEEKEDKGGKKFEKPKKGEIPAALKKYQDKKKK